MKTFFPWKFNLEYSGIFTKLLMHVSSRNMFPTIRNLQIRVHVYRPRHCCGDWLTFGCFVPMIADHDLVTKRWTIMDAEVSTHTFLTMIIEESVCFMSCEPFFVCNYSYMTPYPWGKAFLFVIMFISVRLGSISVICIVCQF